MRQNRFFIKNIDLNQNSIEIEDVDVIHQIKNVLRLKAGDNISVFNQCETEVTGPIIELMKKKLIFSKENMKKKSRKNEIELDLCFSLIKKDKVEYVIQKCTEIGVSNFHPIISERTEKTGYKIDRLEKIAKEASEQSGRINLPQINVPVSLGELLKQYETVNANTNENSFYLDLVDQKFNLNNLKQELEKNKNKKVKFFIGPEGGWGKGDLELFKKTGIKPVSLGENILRAETASISIASIILLPH